ncbi:tRNA uridine-5-carboxymethylaminomethyl(34) synthesis GTPase MnmE [Desulfitibacter alkalitolerans]|uniref:tRNA uridine-5-carboxymethylaminomethyl(34) synthesis GTPase MnmE n=1 Tax=Desulfitibacter alkalitolerans TaxID=264641 RepID=UPI000488C9B8|nr:tRNA uridine-5-carboxymethylaminomethyl(34) synthesis GTPase MnmE [Desulfitibacter alkalitolerans]
MHYIDDTIAGIATPPGEGGISIIKISGVKSLELIKEIFVTKANKYLDELLDRHFYLGKVYDGAQLIDEVMMVVMLGPNTYTGEDVVEIHCHGGVIVTRKILDLVLKKGIRMADPGEFTKRAFLNGKIDLSQAEAIIDIITAKSDRGLNSAVKQLGGGLKEAINVIIEKIEKVLANLEAEIDFPEEDIETMSIDEIENLIDEAILNVEALIKEAEAGRISREGVNTVIVGKPNVGKSSLLNALARHERAIVTDIPGTTRDIIEESIQIKGVLFRINDTAGFRDTQDIVEKIGLEKSQELLLEADLVLFVIDDTQRLTEDDYRLIDKLAVIDKKLLVIINKIDLRRFHLRDEISKLLPSAKIIEISALEKTGINLVEEELVNMVFKGEVVQNQDYVITRTRHKNALINAKKHLQEGKKTIAAGFTGEFLSIDLKDAWMALGQITGDTIEKDIMDKIFSEFCIGK